MPFIPWTSSLSVNIASIDRQHQELIAMINDLHEAMTLGKGKEALGGILDRLARYTQEHFSTEEKWMQAYGFPAYSQHKEEHAAFIQKVQALQKQFAASQLAIAVPTMNFLRDWLTHHIQGTDQKYAPFLIQKGVH